MMVGMEVWEKAQVSHKSWRFAYLKIRQWLCEGRSETFAALAAACMSLKLYNIGT